MPAGDADKFNLMMPALEMCFEKISLPSIAKSLRIPPVFGRKSYLILELPQNGLGILKKGLIWEECATSTAVFGQGMELVTMIM
jgi:hypothetical protein